MQDKLPVYNVSIDPKHSDGEELGVNEIAFVSDPAILVKGVAFSSTPKYRIAAPALIPMNIYRVSEGIGEYEVQFTEQDIEMIVQDFQSKSKTSVFNLEHQTGKIAPAYILESWLVRDPATDQSKTVFGIDGVTQGSWFVVAQITDPAYYEQLVKNDQVGFSIEGFLGLEIKQNKMNKKFKLADAKTADGLPLFIDGDLAIGSSVFVIDENGDKQVPDDGALQLSDGSTIEIEDGVIKEIAAPGEEASDATDPADAKMADKPVPVDPASDIPVPTDNPDAGGDAKTDAPEITIDDVNKLIEGKIKDLVSAIADLQTQLDNIGVENQPVVRTPSTKMTITERLKGFYQKN